MARSARTYRMAAWVCAACALVTVLSLAASYLVPGAGASGHWGLIFARGELAVGHASHDIVEDWPEGIEYPLWQFAGSGARAQVWAPVEWRPAHSDMVMVLPGGPSPATYTFDVQWFPLWWPTAFFSFAAIFFAFRARRVPPAWICSKCGYDLRGIAGGVCPECGGAAVST